MAIHLALLLAALAQDGGYDPGPPPPLPNLIEQAAAEQGDSPSPQVQARAVEQPRNSAGTTVVFESREVVQEVVAEPEPEAAPVARVVRTPARRADKRIKLQRVR